jgi:hypothetical protein
VTVRLLLDEMYPPKLAEQLRQLGHDVLAVVAVPDLVGVDDYTVLEAATADGRCLVTENVRDFAVLLGHTDHAGVLFVHGRRWPRSRSGTRHLAVALDKAISDGQLPGPNVVTWLT